MLNTRAVTQFVISPNLDISDEKNASLISKNMNTFFQPSLRKAYSAIPLLTKVAEGDLLAVRKILNEHKNPSALLTQKSKIKDLSGRTFEKITPFQYALWAQDILMLKHMQNYLSSKQIAKMIEEHESECKPGYVSANGDYFNLSILCAKLKYYIDHSGEMTQGDAGNYWRGEIGGEQFMLPMHIVNLYCHPTSYFVMNPEFIFDETITQRYDKLQDDTAWYSADLGKTYAISRGSHLDKAWQTNTGAGDWLNIDLNVLSAFTVALDKEMKQFKDHHKKNRLAFSQA